MSVDGENRIRSEDSRPNHSKDGLKAGDVKGGSMSKRLAIPRGVYLFKSHEEADAWMEDVLKRNTARRGD
jgi:hypothetical protein